MTIDELVNELKNGTRSFRSIDVIDSGDLSNWDLQGVSFEECFLTGLDFTNCNLKNARFIKANLKTCCFRKADLTNAVIRTRRGRRPLSPRPRRGSPLGEESGVVP